ncbi:MAG: hypothetical protein JW837_11190 [Sedimentisphaerales bacterium]|nr:hypothetical protein [Sedimentisphaerales bacterium]
MRSRRYSIISGLLILALLFFGLYLILRVGNVYEWVFVYYMSYDNDLNPYGKVILDDLAKGVVNSKVAVVVQGDFTDSRGMRRTALYNANGKPRRKENVLKSEDSADENELRKYLEWVRKKWKAENYCIVFLNHGGTLNHMCLDNKPFEKYIENQRFASGKWLSASKAGEIVADFNRKIDGKVRLLFLQQCGRASIQNLYNFTDAAEYILASPLKVDAPNTYYIKTLELIARDRNVTGEALAMSIMQEDEHYTLYTLISNEELKKLPEKLEPVLKALGQNSSLSKPDSCPILFEYEDEKFYDLVGFLEALSSANNDIAGQELSAFFEWCRNSLIVRKVSKSSDASYCGLSIYVPSSGETIGRYSFLPIYQQTGLEHIMKLMF